MILSINFNIKKSVRWLAFLLGIFWGCSVISCINFKSEKSTSKAAIESCSIHKLVAEGKTKDALQCLIEGGNKDALLLKQSFDDAKKMWDAGIISYEEWTITQNRVNYAILELVKLDPTTDTTKNNGSAQEAKKEGLTLQTKTKVKELVQNDKTEDALRLFCDFSNNDCILLLARLTNAKKHLDQGLIAQEDFDRIKHQINFGILTLLEEND